MQSITFDIMMPSCDPQFPRARLLPIYYPWLLLLEFWPGIGYVMVVLKYPSGLRRKNTFV